MRSKNWQTRTWARSSAALFAMTVTAGLALAASEPAKKIGEFDDDDGTYAIETVTSVEACEALCKADKLCRGTVVYQEDISKPEMQCRLNNGFGANAAFPRIAPEPIDFDKALADLNAYRTSKGLIALRYDERLSAISRRPASSATQVRTGLVMETVSSSKAIISPLPERMSQQAK